VSRCVGAEAGAASGAREVRATSSRPGACRVQGRCPSTAAAAGALGPPQDLGRQLPSGRSSYHLERGGRSDRLAAPVCNRAMDFKEITWKITVFVNRIHENGMGRTLTAIYLIS